MVRAGYEAFSRGDIEAALARASPRHRVVARCTTNRSTDPYRGHDGYRRLVAGIRRRLFRISSSRSRSCSLAERTRGGVPSLLGPTAATAARPSRSRETHSRSSCATARSLRSAMYREKAEALEAVGLRE